MKPAAGTTTLTRKSGLDPVVSLGLAGVLIFFVISAFIAYYNLQTLQLDNQKIVHSHEVIVALDTLLSTAQDAETGQRGFLLTGNERYLEPYNNAVSAIPVKIGEIAQLTSDNPVQQVNIAALKQHADAKLAELKETIDLRRTQKAGDALTIVNTDRGKVE